MARCAAVPTDAGTVRLPEAGLQELVWWQVVNCSLEMLSSETFTGFPGYGAGEFFVHWNK